MLKLYLSQLSCWYVGFPQANICACKITVNRHLNYFASQTGMKARNYDMSAGVGTRATQEVGRRHSFLRWCKFALCLWFGCCCLVVGGLFLAIGKLPWIKRTGLSSAVSKFSIYKHVLRLWISSPCFLWAIWCLLPDFLTSGIWCV